MENEERYTGSVFLIEVDKIRPNPYQPRQEFNEDRLRDLADSIRMYGVLQPLVVTRKESEKPDGGILVEYELIAGERRLRASKIAGLFQVPAVIKTGEQSDKLKLEMAIIENLQREDLNPVDRAQAFFRLANEFSLKHNEIGKRVGKSREYVTNSIRIMSLPQEVLDAIVAGQISEGHTRPILMLTDRPEEQSTLFKEIVARKMTVREAELIARRIAVERARKRDFLEPGVMEMEGKLGEKYGTRVRIEKKEKGGRVVIDFFSPEDLDRILALMASNQSTENQSLIEQLPPEGASAENPTEDIPPAEQPEQADEDLYFIKNFSV